MTIRFGSLRPGFTMEQAALAYLGSAYDGRQTIESELRFIGQDDTFSKIDLEPELKTQLVQIDEIVIALEQSISLDPSTCLKYLQRIEYDSYHEDPTDYSRSTLTRASLSQWFNGHGLSTKVFDPPAPFVDTGGNNTSSPERDKRQQQITTLLAREHPCDSPELVICLEAWLSLTESAGREGLKNGITTEIIRWLSSNHPELSNAAIDRISKVTNWNKPD